MLTTDTQAATRPPLSDVLRSLGACRESIAWAGGYGAAYTTALAACPDRSWLTWLYGRLLVRGHVRREPLVSAVCLCAREVLHLVPAGEERPLRAIETAEAWCRGEATLDEARAARRDAWDAAYAADAASAADADAYAAAAYAADAYAYAYARRETQQKTADIVRSMITVEEVEMAIQGQGRER